MKTYTLPCLLVLVTLLIFAGCATDPVTYSFTGTGQSYSSIIFQTGNPGVSFVSFNGRSLPKPEKKTRWEPVNFPSETELRIIIHVKYETQSKTTLSGFGLLGVAVNLAQNVSAVSRNVDVEMVFSCPPLEAGGNYILTFIKEPGLPGINILTLTNTETMEIIFQEEFEVEFGGASTR